MRRILMERCDLQIVREGFRNAEPAADGSGGVGWSDRKARFGPSGPPTKRMYAPEPVGAPEGAIGHPT